jgi:hypothetical protein
MALLLAGAMLVGCTGAKHDSPTPSASAPSSSTSATTVPTTTAAAKPDSSVSNGKSYTVTMNSIDGDTLDGKAKWHMKAGQLSGGDAAVAEAFNKASLSSAQQLIDQIRTESNPRLSWDLEGRSTVTFRNAAIAQVLSGSVPAGAVPPSTTALR